LLQGCASLLILFNDYRIAAIEMLYDSAGLSTQHCDKIFPAL
jgi:hypothetical protein